MKMKYEKPETKLYQIEMEGGFCAASGEKIVVDDNTEVTIERQEGFDEGDIIIEGWE